MFSSHHKLLLKRSNCLTDFVYKHYLYAFSTDEEEEEQVLFEDISLKLPFSLKNHRHYAGNSCGGIVWFHDLLSNELFVWNPTTSELTTLPPDPNESEVSVNFSGFGYDSISDDYKFIRIISPPQFETFGGWDLTGHTTRAELYSFNTSWKEISKITVPNNSDQIDSAYVDGIYYWRATFDYFHFFIFSFDFANETFSTLPFPDHPDFFSNYYHRLLNFDGSLGVLGFIDDCYDATTPLYVELWVLNLESSLWTRVFDVLLDGVVDSPLGFGGNACRFLFCEGKPGTQLLVYDRITQELKELDNYDTYCFEIISSVETTNPLPKPKHATPKDQEVV